MNQIVGSNRFHNNHQFRKIYSEELILLAGIQVFVVYYFPIKCRYIHVWENYDHYEYPEIPVGAINHCKIIVLDTNLQRADSPKNARVG